MFFLIRYLVDVVFILFTFSTFLVSTTETRNVIPPLSRLLGQSLFFARINLSEPLIVLQSRPFSPSIKFHTPAQNTLV
jgi:hypothetical protein